MSTTARLTLEAADVAEAERIVARRPGRSDRWAEDFPFDGDVLAATMLLLQSADHGDPAPFGHYVVRRRADGLAVGGIGFKGPPVDGEVEIGYGLVPSARGHGFAAEAVAAVVGVAREQGLTRVVADTDLGNIASQRTLERAGFTETGREHGIVLYELVLTPEVIGP
ncbi:GNAT family N-acetyltransferase [Phycicoccus flavus]|uniref:GNAT family N-acetyltransferase n=1 Tax=Phycicoccus flavus TaxID=2502783 RepID=A0A8T6R5B9_9MICO|nr:GNAT family N-acetyltransferase [Phycicoccus flavus]NHA67421.1 GNAT family N-acetyltransferase [Phycicoccus flavus]